MVLCLFLKGGDSVAHVLFAVFAVVPGCWCADEEVS